MMVKLGNFLFRYRNGLFPLVYGLMLLGQWKILDSDLWAALIGFAVAVMGQSLRALTIGLAYIIRGGKNRRVYAQTLVTEGVFAHCRNPLYAGNFLIITGLAIAANSPLFAAIGVPFFLFAYLAIIAAEEAYLQEKFGQEFVDYRGRVNRLVPDFSGIGNTLREMEFNWKRLILKEYGSTFAWSAAMIVIVMRNIWLHTGYDAGREFILILTALLLLVTATYAVARYLKKTRILRAD